MASSVLNLAFQLHSVAEYPHHYYASLSTLKQGYRSPVPIYITTELATTVFGKSRPEESRKPYILWRFTVIY